MGDVDSVIIKATHPANYQVESSSCDAMFDGCDISEDSDYSFENPVNTNLFDDHNYYLLATRLEKWWRPTGMKVWVDSNDALDNIHYIEIGKKTEYPDDYRIFFVLYSDGNMRLIPHPSDEGSGVCFGSSILIGSSDIAKRPSADISSLHFISTTNTIELEYNNGDQLQIRIETINSNEAKVKIDFQKIQNREKPFLFFRSMFVTDEIADVGKISYLENNEISDQDILSFTTSTSSVWNFYRTIQSQHNQSAPDFELLFYDDKEECGCAELKEDGTIVADNFYFADQLLNLSFTLSPVIEISDLAAQYWELEDLQESSCECNDNTSCPVLNDNLLISIPCIKYNGIDYNTISMELLYDSNKQNWKLDQVINNSN